MRSVFYRRYGVGLVIFRLVVLEEPWLLKKMNLKIENLKTIEMKGESVSKMFMVILIFAVQLCCCKSKNDNRIKKNYLNSLISVNIEESLSIDSLYTGIQSDIGESACYSSPERNVVFCYSINKTHLNSLGSYRSNNEKSGIMRRLHKRHSSIKFNKFNIKTPSIYDAVDYSLELDSFHLFGAEVLLIHDGHSIKFVYESIEDNIEIVRKQLTKIIKSVKSN